MTVAKLLLEGDCSDDSHLATTVNMNNADNSEYFYCTLARTTVLGIAVNLRIRILEDNFMRAQTFFLDE